VAIFTKDFAVYFSPLWTAFFGISFAIQDPVKEFVSACIFVFAQHPYDVGDLVILEDEKDLKLVATEIYLMHTTFQPVGGGKEYHIPHTKLSKECIENLCRPDSHISVVLHLKFKEIPQNIEKMKMKRKIQKRLKRKLKKEVSKIQDSETEDSETDDSETDDSETEDSEPNAFKHYQKHQTLRLYKMPRVTLAAVKEEDFVEGGIQVEFKVKPQVHPLILFRINVEAKLPRLLGFLGHSIRTLKDSEMKYCIMSAVDWRRYPG
jgi:small-conductance mechanosensitive channel